MLRAFFCFLLAASALAQSNPEYGKLPLAFEPNQGQTDPQVKFLSRGPGYTLFLTGGDAVLSLEKAALRLQLVDPNSKAEISAADELPGKSNYFIGNDPKKWRTNVSTYAKVKYRGIYPGVDLLYYGNREGRLEYDFIVAPGSDPEQIRLSISGAAAALRIDANGDLVVSTTGGEVRYQRPVAYQHDAQGDRQIVDARYLLRPNHEIAFEVGTYDTGRPLVIDPVLVYSTYLAGNLRDEAYGIAVDNSGSAYITGLTNSTGFPVTAGAYDSTCGTDGMCNANGAFNTANTDVFVTKLNATGTALVYSTYLGGSFQDIGTSIAVDSLGNAYVAGYSFSTDFPVTPGAFQTACGPIVGRNNFTCVINATTTCGTGGHPDAFVTKLNPSGSALMYSTFLGGTDGEGASAIAVNAAGEAYIAGWTTSQQSLDTSLCNPGAMAFAYPTTPSGFMAAPAPSGTAWPGSYGAAFAVFSKLKADGSALIYSSYLGAGGSPYASQSATAVTFDGSGNGYITGVSNAVFFPTTPGVYQPAVNGYRQDAFVAKFNPNLSGASSLVYSTFLGGTGADQGTGMAVDNGGNAYVTGITGCCNDVASTDFPTTPGAFQTTCPPPCGNEGWVAKLNPTASALVYSSYLGAHGSTQPAGIAVDSQGRAYVAGTTNAANFPTLNPVQPGLNGEFNVFVTTFNPAGTGLAFSTYLGAESDFGTAIAIDRAGSIYVTGYGNGGSSFPTTPGAFQTTCPKCATVSNGGFAFKIGVPDLTIAKTDSGNFTQGQSGSYTISVANSGSGPTTGTVTVTDTLPAGLTATAISGAGWTCTLAALTCTRADTLNAGASYAAVTLAVNIASNAPASVTNTATVSGGAEINTTNDTASDTATVIQVVHVTVTTSPAGGSFSVDGAAYTSSQTLTWVVGSTHTLATTSSQTAAGTMYTFLSWSDAGAISHSVTAPTTPVTYTANFKTQYQLTISASPAAGGTVTPASGGFYDAGSVVNITGTAASGYTFVGWSGPAASPGSASTTVIMSAPVTLTANFTTKMSFYPVAPCRVVDTRGANGMFGGPALTAGQTRSFAVPASNCNIPSAALAYSLNFTVVPRTTLTYLTAWPAGQAQPLVSTLNSFDGAIVANAAIVPAGANGAISVFVTDATDLIIDINGYFAPPGTNGLAFYPATPCRIADTRCPTGTFGGPAMTAAQTRSFPVPASICNIPSTALAYSLNVTVVPPGPMGYLTTWPVGQAQPLVSTLNSYDGRVVANAAIVPAGTNGAIDVFVSGATNVILDINGYFAPPGGAGELFFYAATPCRIADTRAGSGFTGAFGAPSLGQAATRILPISTSACGLPAAAQAYSLNFTVVPPGPLTYLTTWPAGSAQPLVSTLNSFLGKVVANAAIVPAGNPAGGINVYVSNATDLIIDVNGYFAP